MSPPPANRPPSLREAERIVRDAVDTGRLERGPADSLARCLDRSTVAQHGDLVEVLAEAAYEAKRRIAGDVVTVSRNVFIPLTNLCRNRCSYCTFAKRPVDADAKTYRLDEVAEVSRRAARVGCTEALFCLGDKPELAFPSYREWLETQGYAATADYLVDGCRTALDTGVLPHSNAGLLTQEQMTALRPLNASMGLMLESTSQRLHQKGGAHFSAPDKRPELRLRMHREAGELKIPFTSGILLGIGETADERVDTLLAIRELSDRYGHIQEAIVQPFHPKADTKMRGAPTPAEDELVAWVAMARLLLGPAVNVQAPPNLTHGSADGDGLIRRLVRAGVSDWGGVSPLTIDFINPEAPWPKLGALRRQTVAAGAELRERLPVYPRTLLERPDFFEPSLRQRALGLADAKGYARPRQALAREEAA